MENSEECRGISGNFGESQRNSRIFDKVGGNSEEIREKIEKFGELWKIRGILQKDGLEVEFELCE